MAKKRQRRSAQFKFHVAIEALKEQKTLGQLASEYDVHPTQIAQWKKQLLEGGSSLFGQQRAREQHEHSAREAELFEQIGRLKMELEWLKKSGPVHLRTSAHSSSRITLNSASGNNVPSSGVAVPPTTTSRCPKMR